MDIGQKIQTIRTDHGMTQAKFAEKFHVSRQTVSNWENNKNYPDLGTLRQISDEYGLSFDELLKEDEEYIKKVDQTREKVSTFKRALIIALAILAALVVSFFIMINTAFQPTTDGGRINSDTTIRMLVDLKDATPSRAITFTTDKTSDSNGYESMIKKYIAASRGKVEGDIPCIVLEDNPEIVLHFQDLNYNNIVPKTVIGVNSEFTNVISDKQDTEFCQLKYECKDGDVIIDLSQFDYNKDEESGEIWYDAGIVIKYEYDGLEYTSVTTLTVFNKRSITNTINALQ